MSEPKPSYREIVRLTAAGDYSQREIAAAALISQREIAAAAVVLGETGGAGRLGTASRPAGPRARGARGCRPAPGWPNYQIGRASCRERV